MTPICGRNGRFASPDDNSSNNNGVAGKYPLQPQSDSVMAYCQGRVPSDGCFDGSFWCLPREASVCCDQAVAPSCGLVCKGLHLPGVSGTREMLAGHCKGRDREVETCVQRRREPQHPVNQIYLHCCDKTEDNLCRDTCKSVLQTAMSEDDRMDILMKTCPTPSIVSPIWQCFLKKENKKPNSSTPMMHVDNAKLLCCGKAVSDRCRNLCTKTYKKSWAFGTEFETSCSYIQPLSNAVEASMHKCLNDVEQPCRAGCSGLSFCRNFNYRPTELFRSCTPEADDAARRVYHSWMNGVIELPQMILPVKASSPVAIEREEPPEKRFKDSRKRTLSACDIDDQGWSDLATDQSTWPCTIQEATTKFEEERITAANNKRLRRNNPAQTPTPHPCIHYSRICRARIGLISHERVCRQRHGQPP
ncbi:reversion-inducing cysteine-rich protein with Kazal motifs-like [Elysia marginata]|uniref:Reversion-inducing cysteine-rich protein with Kazal motifs-like n=1 Tax=Elysia marginata TaxID=1093978 RepID=A0AAV4HAZ3_9GAST|nr:reversion-inducing cysteine-rich protein with Kazal motifs-like [Elysia marginata]